MTDSDYIRTLDAINAAGYRYVSEWVGEGDDMAARLTLTSRTVAGDVRVFHGASPDVAALKAALHLGVDVAARPPVVVLDGQESLFDEGDHQ